MLYQLSYFRIVVVGADGFEPPKVKTSRFTVCPIWPLWNTPLFIYQYFYRFNSASASLS